MTDGYFLPKHEQDQLVELLDQIPALIEDLTIALTRQDRISAGGPRVRSGTDEQPLPINIAAMEASDLLHDTLTGWVRLVCDVRAYGYPGDSTLTLTRWLKTHIIALALTPGAEESLDEIQHAIRKARQAVDKPRDRSRVLLGYCSPCATQVWGEPTIGDPRCRTCGAELSMELVRQEIDATMETLILPAKEAAVIITTRYGTAIKPKSIYDMAYRAKNPIAPVELKDGTTGFDVRAVVDDLKRRGKIA